MADELNAYRTDFSRKMYNQMRKNTGCPPVISMKLSPAYWGWYVEMKDGSFHIDAVPESQATNV